MVRDYAPRLFLRLVDKGQLRDYFSGPRQLEGVNWAAAGDLDVRAVYEAWQKLGAEVQEKTDTDLRSVFEMGTAEGTLALIEEGRFQNLGLAEELEPWAGHYDKAFHVFLKHPEVFNLIRFLEKADHLNGRFWCKRKGMPKADPDNSQAALDALGVSVSQYYRENQGRGKWCTVELYARGGGDHYFFVYPKDYPETLPGYDHKGKFQRITYNPAFEIIFRYNPEDGDLDLFAKGDRRLKQDLLELFAQAILHQAVGADELERAPYQLNNLIDRSFKFPTDPRDCVCDVRVRELRISPVGSPKHRITLEAPAKGDREDIYDLMERSLNQESLPISRADVSSAVLQMTFDTNGQSKRSSTKVTFRITYPDACTLKDKPEHQIARKYLRIWGIERA